ncbi:MAG: hypothetical protein LBC51_06600 [Treponema sp.]|jgi:hypothetical protein|nr:hypothetical protein [Treponema sp.]
MKEKRALFDELTRLTGRHRKSAVRILRSKPVRELMVYADSEAVKLKQEKRWPANGKGKRVYTGEGYSLSASYLDVLLVPIFAPWPAYHITGETAEKLKTISPATIDRHLKKDKEALRLPSIVRYGSPAGGEQRGGFSCRRSSFSTQARGKYPERGLRNRKCPVYLGPCLAYRRERAPLIRNDSPLIRERAPLIRERAPLIRERAPLMRERAPLMRERAPLIRKRAPLIRKRAPLIRKSSPFVLSLLECVYVPEKILRAAAKPLLAQ